MNHWNAGMSLLVQWYQGAVKRMATELAEVYRKELDEHIQIDIKNGHDYDVDLYYDESREVANRWLTETVSGSEIVNSERKAAMVLVFTDHADEWKWVGGNDPRCPITDRAYCSLRADVLDQAKLELVERGVEVEQERRREAADEPDAQ